MTSLFGPVDKHRRFPQRNAVMSVDIQFELPWPNEIVDTDTAKQDGEVTEPAEKRGGRGNRCYMYSSISIA